MQKFTPLLKSVFIACVFAFPEGCARRFPPCVNVKRKQRWGYVQTTHGKHVSKSWTEFKKKKVIKSHLCSSWFPLLFLLRQMRSSLLAARARSPREDGEETRAGFLCTGGRAEAGVLLCLSGSHTRGVFQPGIAP